MLGTRWSSGRAESRTRRSAMAEHHQPARPWRFGLVAEQIGQHGLAGNVRWPDQDQRLDALGQVDVAAAAEADQADPLARLQAGTLLDERRRSGARPARRSARGRSRGRWRARIWKDWRSFSSDALSNEALRNLPGW